MTNQTELLKRVKSASTSDQAVELAELKWWVGVDDRAVALTQLSQGLLCMDFSDFHKAVESAAGRPVWTHEFAKPDSLIAEIKGRKSAPTSPFESLAETMSK